MNQDYSSLERKIAYEFNNKDLLINALTHTSFANEHRYKKIKDNERLEFLGDAVLELVSSEFLFNNMHEMPEGEMTRLRASLVCEPTLANDAREIGLEDYIYLGKGEEATGGRHRDSIVSDTFEALIGSIFLDGGIEEAKRFILEDFFMTVRLFCRKGLERQKPENCLMRLLTRQVRIMIKAMKQL